MVWSCLVASDHTLQSHVCNRDALSLLLVAMTTLLLHAVIPPATSHPHTRGLCKADPVSRYVPPLPPTYSSPPCSARYHEYRAMWERQQAPGEKNRNSLRWQIRVHLPSSHSQILTPFLSIRSSSSRKTDPHPSQHVLVSIPMTM